MIPMLKFSENALNTKVTRKDFEKYWHICSAVKDSVENGKRIENLSWRIWGSKRIKSLSLSSVLDESTWVVDWEEMQKTASSLFSELSDLFYETELHDWRMAIEKEVKEKEDFSASIPIQKICSNCTSGTTTMWRKINDLIYCNACALYLKVNGVNRPDSLKMTYIKRKRVRL